MGEEPMELANPSIRQIVGRLTDKWHQTKGEQQNGAVVTGRRHHGL